MSFLTHCSHRIDLWGSDRGLGVAARRAGNWTGMTRRPAAGGRDVGQVCATGGH